MLGFKSFGSARRTLRGIELMHMIKKGQMRNPQGSVQDKTRNSMIKGG